MKKVFVAVALTFLFCALAVHAGRQEKSDIQQASAAIVIPPAVSCAAQGMATPTDAVWIAGECEKRETARFFLAMGQNKAALTILCDTRAAKEAKACPGQ
jgi:hypothetical protein